MKKITFTKAVGSGNDFIILDNRDKGIGSGVRDLSRFARSVSRRIFSVGADGVLVLENSRKADFTMRVFNPDGAEVSMCGNGARCAALYAVRKGWCSRKPRIKTGAGVIRAAVDGGDVTLKMTNPKGLALHTELSVQQSVLKAHFIDTGVPHVVLFLKRVRDYPVKIVGARIRYHANFSPGGANVNFVEVLGRDRIRVRTYERGVEDETLACGTGSVASAIVSHLVNGTGRPVKVRTESGDVLTVSFMERDNKISQVSLKGPAKIVYEGEMYLR